MITITRSLARQLRAVFRRAGAPRSGANAWVVFLATADALRVRFQSPNVALEYCQPGQFQPGQLTISYEFLADCEGRKDEPVTLQKQADGRALVSWSDRAVPQMAQYDADPPALPPESPALPEHLHAVEPGLWAALADAAQTTQQNSTRYALNNVQLRGAGGQISATDGGQILVQAGNSFPWQEDLMVPAAGLWSCPELSPDQELLLGKSDDWVAFVMGAWAVQLKIDKEGKFPKLDDLFRPVDQASSRLHLDPADARFLVGALPRLPGAQDPYSPITLDLNGRVAIRAADDERTAVAELTLSNSQCSGAPIVVSINRRFLLRAARLGFTDIYAFSPETPLQCSDERRKYLWAVLAPGDAIKATANQVTIASPLANQDAATIPLPNTRQRHTMRKKRTSNETTAPPVPASATSANQLVAAGKSPGPIERAQVLRGSLREALTKTDELISALKRQRRQSKLVETTLSALDELRSAG